MKVYKIKAENFGYYWCVMYKRHWFSKWEFVCGKNTRTIKTFKILRDVVEYVQKNFQKDYLAKITDKGELVFFIKK